jgi:hypothetical protein
VAGGLDGKIPNLGGTELVPPVIIRRSVLEIRIAEIDLTGDAIETLDGRIPPFVYTVSCKFLAASC